MGSTLSLLRVMSFTSAFCELQALTATRQVPSVQSTHMALTARSLYLAASPLARVVMLQAASHYGAKAVEETTDEWFGQSGNTLAQVHLHIALIQLSQFKFYQVVDFSQKSFFAARLTPCNLRTHTRIFDPPGRIISDAEKA